MNIQVTVRNVYGNTMVYPVCETAIKFTKLTGRKTFTHSDLCLIESLGYTVENVAQALKRSA